MALLRRSKPAAPTKGGRGAAPKSKVKGARAANVRAAFTATRSADPRLLPLLLAAFFTPFMLLLALGLLVDHPVYLGLVGFMLGLLAMTIVFGKRVQRTAYAGVEGQLGAAAAVLSSMRGDWRVTPAVGFNREQELLHRVVGRPGIALVAEGVPGQPHRGTRNLVANEKKKLARFVPSDVPVYDVYVGEGEGLVTLRQLEKHFAKLPRNIKPKQVNELDVRLKALGAAVPPIPRGPMPKNGRVPRGKVR